MIFPKAWKKIGLGLLTWAALGLILLFSASVRAQVAGATLSGVVTDSSGAVIPGAQISIRNLATGISRSVTTDAAGFYTAPNLLPGNYEIRVTAPGFATEVRTGITLTVGAQQALNLAMRVGQVTETVQVTGDAPTVELATSTISGIVNGTTVRDLPLNGRDWTQLATLQPGVTSDGSLQEAPGPNGHRLNRGYGTQMTISGSRPQENNYRIDGIAVNDYTNGGPSGVAGLASGVDAVREFSVLTSTYTSEYGRTSGGVVNAITRSGTNQFHGDVFEFLRNSALDAANFFDNFSNITKPPFKQNQFGGAVGGPIRKDRTFFFGDYEGLRRNRGITSVDTVPSLDARNGIIHNNNGTTTTIKVDPLVQPYLPLWALPNGALFPPGNTGIFSFAGSQVISDNFATARVDHKISSKDSLSGSWQIDKATSTVPDPLDDLLSGAITSRHFVMLEESHIFTPQLLNSFRVGYNRAVAESGTNNSPINPLTADPSLAAISGKTNPAITVTGLTPAPAGVTATSINNLHWNSFQGYDDAFLSKGIQSLKFGFSVERDDLNLFSDSRSGGGFAFGSLTDFLTNKPTSFGAGAFTAATLTARGYRQTILGAYVQDDVRWRPNLTVNLGLRYEMSSVPTEVQAKLSTVRNVYTDSAPHLGDPLFSNPTLRNFEPRVGFAWDPSGNSKTAVRGSFGIFDALPLLYEIWSNEAGAAPFYAEGSVSGLAQGSFPTGAFALLRASNRLRSAYFEPNPHRSYVMHWNLNLQRELMPDFSAMIAYVGSHGVHEPFHADDMDVVLPTLTAAGYLWPFPAGSGTALNPNFSRIDTTQWSNSTSYEGLELQLTKKMSHGFQVQGSYTWSKAIDDGSATALGDNFLNSISGLLFFDPNLRRGLADFSVGQNLTINYLWLIPAPQSLHGPAAWVVGGWQLGGIFQANTGLPFTPLIGGDPLGLNNSFPFDFPNRLTGPGCQSLINPGNVRNYIKLNCFALPTAPASLAAPCTPFPGQAGTCSNLLGNSGRNDLIGPGLANLDFSLFKNNYIRRVSESFNVQFRAEFFNVLNRANFDAPIDNSKLFDRGGTPVGGAGLIDATSTNSRQIQFGLKLIW